jgi:prepilin-type N-terminal cleavage/methylation domain-containing protein
MSARGFTLIELVMALVVIAVALSVVGLSIRVMEPGPDAVLVARAQAARDRAIREGRPVRLDSTGISAWFAPDGTARGVIRGADGSVAHLEALTGAVHVTTH